MIYLPLALAAALSPVALSFAETPDFEALRSMTGAEALGPGLSRLQARKGAPAACADADPFAITGANLKTGECADLSEFRVVNYLEGRPNGYLAQTNSYDAFAWAHGFKTDVPRFASYPIVANLKHEGRFWLAQLDLRHVQAVYFQVEEFKIAVPQDKLHDPAIQALLGAAGEEAERLGPAALPDPLRADIAASLRGVAQSGAYTAAHGQLRVDFASPIPLASQDGAPAHSSVRSVVFSIHAVAKAYDPIKGMQDEYPLALGAYSAREKFVGSVLEKKNAFRQYRLNLSPGDLEELVTLYLKSAERLFRERPYNTLSANCGSLWFETADQAFMLREHPDVVQRAKDDAAASLGRSYPKYAQYALAAYGWLSNPRDLAGEPWTELPSP
ncbi:MAG: DUF4105 domain-containing protein [Elusimicrobia bacterium]|nr:DUF4105 domain-containing protein [Elusimicrobiota bacterium]